MPKLGLTHAEELAFARAVLVYAGYALVSVETDTLVRSIEDRLACGVAIPSRDFEAALYAIFAGSYGDHHRASVFA